MKFIQCSFGYLFFYSILHIFFELLSKNIDIVKINFFLAFLCISLLDIRPSKHSNSPFAFSFRLRFHIVH